jgi:hypothetical protein
VFTNHQQPSEVVVLSDTEANIETEAEAVVDMNGPEVVEVNTRSPNPNEVISASAKASSGSSSPQTEAFEDELEADIAVAMPEMNARPPLVPELEEEPKPALRLLTPKEVQAELNNIKARVKILQEEVSNKSLYQLDQLQHQLHHRFRSRIQHAVVKLQATQKDPEALGAVLLAWVMAMETAMSFFLDPEFGLGWRRASVFAARAQGFKGKKRACNIRTWIHIYLDSDCRVLPLPAYRGNRESLLADEDFAHDLQLYLLEKGKEVYIKGQTVADYVASQAVQEQYGAVRITEQTGTRWLQRMKWRYGKTLRGMYIDGHERPDIVAYRDAFINRWTTQYLPRMYTYLNNGDIGSTPKGFPVPQGHCFCIILVTHDESTFYACDRRKSKWNAPAHLAGPSTERKGEGASYMVSDFLTVEWGRLVDDDGE